MPKEVKWEDLTEEQRTRLENKIQKYLQKVVPEEKRGLNKSKESKVKQEPIEQEPIIEPIPKNKKIDTSDNHLIGKYMLRELPFFRIEPFIYFAILFAGILLWYFDIRGFWEGGSRIALFIAILAPVMIWFMKWQFYMPRKNRVPGMKLYKSGVVELGIFDITKRYLTLGRGEDKRKKFITKINKHVEASTGRPFVAVSELEGENIDLLRTDNPDMKSEEINALLETNTMVTTKAVMARMLRFTQPKMNNPLVILLIIVVVIEIVLVAQGFGVFDLI